MPRSQRKRPKRKPFAWADVDASEMESAPDRDALRLAQRRFIARMDARYGPGRGEQMVPKVFNYARWVARREGWLDAPETLGSWERGKGYVGSKPF